MYVIKDQSPIFRTKHGASANNAYNHRTTTMMLQLLASAVGWRDAFRITAILPILIAVAAVIFVGDSRLQV